MRHGGIARTMVRCPECQCPELSRRRNGFRDLGEAVFPLCQRDNSLPMALPTTQYHLDDTSERRRVGLERGALKRSSEEAPDDRVRRRSTDRPCAAIRRLSRSGRGSQHFWHDWGRIFYRGRLDGSAKVLCIASDPGPTERIAGHTLVVDAGQRVQGFLAKLGIMRAYRTGRDRRRALLRRVFTDVG
ncbi:hypothetical protein LMG27177_06059 [Paraburkholderia fynbosensis]|uniref:Uncharacterized protein n=1 Tax=Paraburkholderia fynbosensis TaxID=1200993 RepID=A0A6J5GZB9_9BURK|nr:hypothetical protein LMG27177_06059 [Paraburkholderia fynbosensis]